MRVHAKLPGGGTLTLEVQGHDTVETLRNKIAEKHPSAHQDLQTIGLDGQALRDGSTMQELGVQIDTTFAVGLRQPEQEILLNVGGTRQSTVLSTLLAKPGSRIYEMFADMRQGGAPSFPRTQRAGADGLPEGVPYQPGGPLPQGSDGAYLIDRDGPSFRYVVNYLRDGEPALPTKASELDQLAREARYFGLEELAAACACPLQIVRAACGGCVTADEILSLSEEQRKTLCQQQRVSVVVQMRLEATVHERAVEAERLRGAAAAEAEQIRKAAAAVDRLRKELHARRLDLSEAALRALAAAGVDTSDAVRLDAAAALGLGLSEEDARKLGDAAPGVVCVFEGVDNSTKNHGKFDQCGVINHIATQGGTRAWANPHTAGWVRVEFSSCSSGELADLVSKYDAKTSCSSNKQLPAWMRVDLGATRQLCVNHYALRNRDNSGNVLRNWELQGANAADGPWTTLRRHDNDASIEDKRCFVAAWPVDSGGAAFRFFRVHMHGHTSGGRSDYDYLNLGSIEFWGALTGT